MAGGCCPPPVEALASSSPPMIISVKQYDIEQGVKFSAKYCPIAMAASRAFGRDIWVSWEQCFSNSHIKPLLFFSLPQEVRDFVVAFDAGQKVEPFEFFLEYIGVLS